MKKIILYVIGLCLLGICLVALMFDTNGANKAYVEKAEAIVDSVYKYYGIEGTSLLRENYPFDSAFKAGLALFRFAFCSGGTCGSYGE